MPKSRKSLNLDRWVRRHKNKHLCFCGCGEYIEIKRVHAKPSVGVPKFIRGHNLQQSPQREIFIPPPKKSGWDKLSLEEQERRVGQLKNFGKREKNPSWKGGRRVDEAGYVQILMPEHPFAKDGYVPEHRLLAEKRARRQGSSLLIEIDNEQYLKPGTVVHHIDEIKSNNQLTNLMLLPHSSAHAFLHKSPLPMEERLRRIEAGVFHSGPLDALEEDIDADD